jgi:hypothetical protein
MASALTASFISSSEFEKQLGIKRSLMLADFTIKSGMFYMLMLLLLVLQGIKIRKYFGLAKFSYKTKKYI